jgi:hypothetical protein
MHQSSTHHHLQLLAAGVTFAVFAGACDGLADSHIEAPALASLRGTLSLESGKKAPRGDDLRLALIWEVPFEQQPDPDNASDNPCLVDPDTLVPDSTTFSGFRDPAESVRIFISKPYAEQAVSLRSEFPIEFTFDIAEPPPDEALAPIDGYSVSHALGELVVYRDVNQNGKLDASTFERASPVRVLAASAGIGPWGPDERLKIEYFTGKPKRSNSTPPGPVADLQYSDYRSGYNLVPSGGSDSGEQPVPIDTPIALTLQDDPYLRSKLCTQYCQRPLADQVCPMDPAELPPIALRPHFVHNEANAYSDWHDDDGTVTGSERCYSSRASGHNYYEYTTFDFNECIYEVTHCVYRDDKLPEGVSLPCETYPLDPGVAPGEDEAE